jgi:hypothetical protein
MADHRIEPLKKSDLQYDYPKGAAGDDDPSKRGFPDSIFLNRSEWYEMLYFCNKFANDLCQGNKLSALKTERLIKGGSVPSNLHSHENISAWLVANWAHYPKV